MTEQSKGARPSQVTMAGWIAVIGSVLMVLTLFDSVSKLNTVEFRESIDEFLSTPPGSGLGLEISQVQEILRVLMLLSGAAAAAATVLAIYVLQRHNAARVGFTIAAVAIMITAPVSGGFLPVMIAFSAIMLWTKPARDWFAGVPVTQTGSGRGGARGSADDPFAAHQARHRVEGNVVSSENHPPHEQPGAPGNDSGAGGPDDEGRTAPWPRMPEESSDRPLPPPTQGFGTPSAQGQGDQERQPGSSQPGSSGQQPGPSYPQGGGYPPPPGPSYPQGGYPPPGQQPPYGRQPYQGGQPPYGPGPYGQQPYTYPPQYGQPYGAPQRPVDPNERPRTVTVAAWITWALAGLSILVFAMTAFVLGVAQDELIRQIEQDPNFQELDVSTDQLVAGLWALAAITLFWGAAAMLLAWFAYRRANWARITLVVSSGFTVLFSILAFPAGLLHTFGAAAVIALLFTGGANEWYAGRSGNQGHPGPFQPYGQPQHGQAPQQYGGQPPQHGRPGSEYGASQGQPSQGQPQQGQPPQPGGQEPPRERGRDEPPRERGRDEPPPNVW